ncbi:TIGR04211 family SH3 domain-containing protein [Thiomicrospira cyclica]|uniref:SH3-like region n=1 Tax=Thiomicrospira cyclica (strain DSM 14477 / JCM 11371 / ALM1) TaxID=717773 RepID=F6DA29_THICA|nr:TIGR04211 family SH3 domain-containing protein [Thiomicrospira cyclica]AEG32160.1 SH3-like region [Thiomicrospira cyclica ALM1]
MTKFEHFNRRTLSAIILAGSLQFGVMTSPALQAQEFTHYVSDAVEQPIRRGAGVEFRIERMLPPGTPLKVLETSDGWSLVEANYNNRTSQGWIHQISIQNQPPARILLNEQRARFSDLENRFNEQRRDYEQLRVNHDVVATELTELKQAHFEARRELEQIREISGQAVELDEQNREMRQIINELEAQQVIMRQQIAQAGDAVKRQWFLTGAGVLLLGLLLGRFFRIPKRRGSWDSV